MTTKSVKVPPVSTPTLEIDPRDILDVFGSNSFEVLHRALRVSLPCEGLKIGANAVESMNRHFAGPREVRVGQGRVGNDFDPVKNLRALFVGRTDLERGTLTGIDAKRGLRPPAGLNDSQIEN